MGGLLFQAFIYLCAAVIAVPIAKRLGLGSVLGYLLAGIVIGPVIGLVGSETQEIQHFAEFGVVMMLFLVGLELQPRMLWEMRTRLIGLGGLQVGITAALIVGSRTAVGRLLERRTGDRPDLLAVVDGDRAADAERERPDQDRGRPCELLGPAVPGHRRDPDAGADPAARAARTGRCGLETRRWHGMTVTATITTAMSLVAGLPGWAHALVVLGAVAAVLLGGHFLSRPLFRFIAASRLREIFTASALLLVIGIALLMTLVDLSPALGHLPRRRRAGQQRVPP